MGFFTRSKSIAWTALYAFIFGCGIKGGEEERQHVSVQGDSAMSNQQTTDKPVRVIVTLADSGDVEIARSSLMQAGALLADPIEGQPMIVVEALWSQLDVGLEEIEVKSVHVDSISPAINK